VQPDPSPDPSPGPIPDFVPPMLAKRGAPFDSEQHLFEIKWDGTRAQARIADGAVELRNRRGEPFGHLFPELAPALADLPSGTILDGEIVVLNEGRVDFSLAMSRVHARGARRIGELARSTPVTYVVFDLLWDAGRSLLEEPLIARRAALARLFMARPPSSVVVSDGVVGAGLDYYEKACAHGFEGVVAKRLDSTYEAGRRSGAWTKQKRVQEIACIVVGWVPKGRDDLASLIVAGPDEEGRLVCLGRVGSGLTTVMRKDLRRRLEVHDVDEPFVPCPYEGRWVEPAVTCIVSFLERTAGGMLRAPVFVKLVEEEM
jgi:DNA ligase D-like protein (predicted ligase)